MNISISINLTDADFQKFKDFFEETIMSLYPNSTLKTAESIIEKHKLGFDDKGYFTKKKTIWKGIDEFDNVVAFTVISEKRGGGIKFGPTMVDKEKRRQGIGSTFRSLVENHYRDLGYRKAYSTTNVKNYAGIYYILKIGYKIEVHLTKHYSKTADEIVLSKMLNPTNNEERVSIINNSPKHIADYMTKYYDDIDDMFFENINQTATDNHTFTENHYIDKMKFLFKNDLDKLYAVVFPKRGGCAKICPLIFNNNENYNLDFIHNLIEFYRNTPVHKLYTFVPVEKHSDICLLKKAGFYTEGIIAEPYKKNVDLIMLSYLIY
jgi:GNAT superfamily N-acetyltransferase